MTFRGKALGFCAVAVGLSLLARSAWADDQPYKALLADGYEIKSVVFLDPQFTTRYGNKYDTQDTVLVTMQKGPSSAACYVYATNWINQNLADSKCSVFK